MRKTKLLTIVIAVILVLALATGCSSNSDSKDEANEETAALSGEITIAAAASLENAFVEELIPMFNEEHPDVTITGTYDASGKLQTQIEEGLGAQIFFSAATKQMDALVDGGFIDRANVTNLLENEVVLITGASSTTSVTSFENIADAATIAIGDPASVPAGQYAQEVLTTMGTWDAVNAKASLGTNVTEVLNWVAEGSAEVGIVYATDAASMKDKVKVLSVAPADSMKTPVVYPIALTSIEATTPEQTEIAEAFLEFLKSPEALKVFEDYGFKSAA